jgi:hypothetical protein
MTLVIGQFPMNPAETFQHILRLTSPNVRAEGLNQNDWPRNDLPPRGEGVTMRNPPIDEPLQRAQPDFTEVIPPQLTICDRIRVAEANARAGVKRECPDTRKISAGFPSGQSTGVGLPNDRERPGAASHHSVRRGGLWSPLCVIAATLAAYGGRGVSALVLSVPGHRETGPYQSDAWCASPRTAATRSPHRAIAVHPIGTRSHGS